jgi:pimeloyl-ACP methyl ester carboxylesterase
VGKALLHYEVHDGRGPFLLLVHGMLASRAQWRLNLGPLSRVSRPVVVELLGHGRSPAPEEPTVYRPERYVLEFERIRAELDTQRWAVCGQSLGAALTLRYALEHPDRVIAQIFTNSNSALAEAGWADAVRPAMEGLSQRLASEGLRALETLPIHPRRSRRMPPEVRDELVSDCDRHDPGGIARTGLYTVPDSSVRRGIARNRVPSLLVVGEREERFSDHRRYAEEVMPHLEVVTADTGHAVNAEAPKEFNSAVCHFLSRIDESR